MYTKNQILQWVAGNDLKLITFLARTMTDEEIADSLGLKVLKRGYFY